MHVRGAVEVVVEVVVSARTSTPLTPVDEARGARIAVEQRRRMRVEVEFGGRDRAAEERDREGVGRAVVRSRRSTRSARPSSP